LSYPAGHVVDRRGPRVVFGVGVVLFGLAYAGLALSAHGWPLLLLFFALAGAGMGLTDTAESALVARLLPDELRGSGFGLLGGVQSLGDFVSSAAVGLVWTVVSPGAAFILAAAWMGLSVAATAGAFRTASRDTGLPLSLLAAVAWEESRMDPRALSAAGAQGLLQVMPRTARSLATRPGGPNADILVGARYLDQLLNRFDGNLELALVAYNAGPTAVEKIGGAPSLETLRYAKNVEARAAALAAC